MGRRQRSLCTRAKIKNANALLLCSISGNFTDRFIQIEAISEALNWCDLRKKFMTRGNMVLRKCLAGVLLLLGLQTMLAQQTLALDNKSDSLKAIYYSSQSETCEIAEIPKYVELVLKTVRPQLMNRSLHDSIAKFYYALQATALNNLGFYFEHEGKNDLAKKFLKSAAQIQRLMGDNKGLSVTLSNLGSVYENTGEVKPAIELFYKSLKIRELLNDKAGMATVLHNIATLHFKHRNFKESYECTNRSLVYRRQLQDTTSVAFSYENLAQLLKEKGDTAGAVNYYAKAATIFQTRNSKSDIASAEVNLGRQTQLQGNFVESKLHFQNAIDIYAAQHQFVLLASVYNSLSEVEFSLGNRTRAIELAVKAKTLAVSTNNVLALTNASKHLSIYYKATSQERLAYENLSEFHKLSDSILNANNRSLFVVEEISHSYEKKAIQDSIRLDRDRKIFEISLQEQRTRFWFGIALLVIVSISSLFIFRKYRQGAKQNLIIANQKIEVEEQKQLAISRLEISEAQKQVIQNSLESLEKTQQRLLLAKIEAEKSSKTKSEFISHVSHEVRTPLNAILGFAELLKARGANEVNTKYIENILLSGKNLLAMVNDLLDFSKSEAGQLQVRNVETNLCELLKECAQMFSNVADEKHLHFEIVCQDNLPESCLIDALRVRQILYNLLGNAFKFTASGKVSLSLSFSYSNEQKNCTTISLSVADTGIGIPEHQQTLIFEAFKQQEGQDLQKYGGTGLGLAITKNIVHALDGTIKVQSTPGFGSTFTVQLNNIEVLQKKRPDSESGIKGKSIAVLEAGSSAVFSDYLLQSAIRVNLIRITTYDEALQVVEKMCPDLFVIALPHEAVSLKRQIELYKIAVGKNVTVLFLSDKKEITALSLLNKAFDLQYAWPKNTQETEDMLLLAIAKHTARQQVSDQYLKQIDFSVKLDIEHFLPRWQKLCEHNSKEDISAFASDLHKFSKAQKLSLVLDYADNLLAAVEFNDGDAIRAQFANFKSILEKQFESA